MSVDANPAGSQSAEPSSEIGPTAPPDGSGTSEPHEVGHVDEARHVDEVGYEDEARHEDEAQYLDDAEYLDEDQDLGEPESEVPLRDVILAQGLLGTAIPVLLFTTEHLTAADHDDLPAGSAADLVSQTARELGLDPDQLALFSDDAYLLQTAIGEHLLPSAG